LFTFDLVLICLYNMRIKKEIHPPGGWENGRGKGGKREGKWLYPLTISAIMEQRRVITSISINDMDLLQIRLLGDFSIKVGQEPGDGLPGVTVIMQYDAALSYRPDIAGGTTATALKVRRQGSGLPSFQQLQPGALPEVWFCAPAGEGETHPAHSTNASRMDAQRKPVVFSMRFSLPVSKILDKVIIQQGEVEGWGRSYAANGGMGWRGKTCPYVCGVLTQARICGKRPAPTYAVC
jgi:hypothetical protein